jgi:hypothetical protein
MGTGSFFSDGNSDVLLQNVNGSVALWDMSGSIIIGGGLVASNPGPTWFTEGTAGGVTVTPGSGSFADAAGNIYTLSAGGVAERNGLPVPDFGGTAKLVYYNGDIYGQDATTGNWFTFDFSDNSPTPSVAPGFFSDGNTAIVLQNNDGSVALWDMNGTTIVGGSGGVANNPGPTWHIEGTGNFFGDGHTAILFQNDDGSVALWDMFGTTVIGGGLVASNPGPTWHIEGTGNFFGDGSTDILWQNNDGSVALWDMNGVNIVGGGLVASAPGPTWHVKGTGDYFGDGNTDIVLQNDNGSVALWDMKGTSIVGGGLVSNPGTGWSAVDNNMQFIYSTSANETLVATSATPDEFVFSSFAAGSNTIDGFNPVQDMIEFSKAQFASFTDVQAATSATSGGSMISLHDGSSLLLTGVDAGSLHASNFALV